VNIFVFSCNNLNKEIFPKNKNMKHLQQLRQCGGIGMAIIRGADLWGDKPCLPPDWISPRGGGAAETRWQFLAKYLLPQNS
jgi:hypothetical protein